MPPLHVPEESSAPPLLLTQLHFMGELDWPLLFPFLLCKAEATSCLWLESQTIGAINGRGNKVHGGGGALLPAPFP